MKYIFVLAAYITCCLLISVHAAEVLPPVEEGLPSCEVLPPVEEGLPSCGTSDDGDIDDNLLFGSCSSQTATGSDDDDDTASDASDEPIDGIPSSFRRVRPPSPPGNVGSFKIIPVSGPNMKSDSPYMKVKYKMLQEYCTGLLSYCFPYQSKKRMPFCTDYKSYVRTGDDASNTDAEPYLFYDAYTYPAFRFTLEGYQHAFEHIVRLFEKLKALETKREFLYLLEQALHGGSFWRRIGRGRHMMLHGRRVIRYHKRLDPLRAPLREKLVMWLNEVVDHYYTLDDPLVGRVRAVYSNIMVEAGEKKVLAAERAERPVIRPMVDTYTSPGVRMHVLRRDFLSAYFHNMMACGAVNARNCSAQIAMDQLCVLASKGDFSCGEMLKKHIMLGWKAPHSWWNKAYRSLEECALKNISNSAATFSFNESDQAVFWTYVEEGGGLDNSLEEQFRSVTEVEAQQARFGKLELAAKLENERIARGYIPEEYRKAYLASDEYARFTERAATVRVEMRTCSSDERATLMQQLQEMSLSSRQRFLDTMKLKQFEAQLLRAQQSKAEQQKAEAGTFRGIITGALGKIKAGFSKTPCRGARGLSSRSGEAGPVGPSGGAGSGAGVDPYDSDKSDSE